MSAYEQLLCRKSGGEKEMMIAIAVYGDGSMAAYDLFAYKQKEARQQVEDRWDEIMGPENDGVTNVIISEAGVYNKYGNNAVPYSIDHLHQRLIKPQYPMSLGANCCSS